MQNKHTYTFQEDLKRRLKNPKFRKAWEDSEVEYLLAKQLIEARFSKMMDVTSIHTGTIQLTPTLNYSLNSRHDFQSRTTKVIIDHDLFLKDTVYSPSISSDIRDAFQNCFSQCLGPR